MKKYRLRDLVPPWSKGSRHLGVCISALAASAFFSFCMFHANLTWAEDELHMWESGHREAINPEARMMDFIHVLGGSVHSSVYLPFGIAVIAVVLLALLNYSGFSQGSRALYLMRRLPDTNELPRRCLALPVLTLLAAVILLALLTLVYWAIYWAVTPDQCMQPDQWTKFWAGLPHLFNPLPLIGGT